MFPGRESVDRRCSALTTQEEGFGFVEFCTLLTFPKAKSVEPHEADAHCVLDTSPEGTVTCPYGQVGGGSELQSLEFTASHRLLASFTDSFNPLAMLFSKRNFPVAL